MSLVTSFVVFVQPLAAIMTAPTFDNAMIIMSGWVFAPRHTVTGMIQAAAAVGRKHHSTFHRLFASARWSRDQLGLTVFDLLTPWLGETVLLALDDTLARKRGLKMFGVGMHHDPLLSSRGKAITNWGHSWVVLGVIVRFPLWPERAFCLPILFRLYRNNKSAAKHRRVYRTRPELAVELLTLLCQARKTQRFHVVADSAYGGQSVINHLPTNCDLTSRLLLKARLHGPRAERQPGTNGRPRKRGASLPTPAQMLSERAARVELEIYGRRDRVRMTDTVAYVHAAPERPLRVVAVEALKGGRGQQAFYSTCWQATAVEVLTWYAWRWSIEVAFHDSKQSLGFEEPQGWTRRAVERTAPMAMLLYSLIVMWFVREGHRSYRSLERPWYTTKNSPSFADMLATLRRTSLPEQLSSWGRAGQGSRKVLEFLENTAALAA